MPNLKAGSQYDAKQCVALHHLCSMLVEMQHDARIDLDPILVFPALRSCVWSSRDILSNKFVCFRINAMQGLVSLCELAFRGSSLVPRLSDLFNVLAFLYATLKS